MNYLCWWDWKLSLSNLEISLVRADLSSIETIKSLQIRAFKNLLDKYKDFKTNPGAENYEDILEKFNARDWETKEFITLDGREVKY